MKLAYQKVPERRSLSPEDNGLKAEEKILPSDAIGKIQDLNLKKYLQLTRLLYVVIFLLLVNSLGLLAEFRTFQRALRLLDLEKEQLQLHETLSPQVADEQLFPYGTIKNDPELQSWAIIPEYKFMACAIAKAGATSMRSLAAKLVSNNCSEKRKYECTKPGHLGIGPKGIQSMLEDSSWIKVAFVRDPKVRLVSGFNDKCGRQCCGNCDHFQSRQNSDPPKFLEFLKTLESEGISNIHFWPQSSICGGLANISGYLDFIGVIDRNVQVQMELLAAKFARLDVQPWKDAVFQIYDQPMMENDTYRANPKYTGHKRSDSLVNDVYSNRTRKLADRLYEEDILFLKSLVKHPNATGFLRVSFKDDL